MKYITAILLTILSGFGGYSQQVPDTITGNWLNVPKETMTIHVYRSNKGFSGKIVSVTDKAKSNTIGFVIIEGLTYNAKTGGWENGKIHNPNNNTTYNASAKIKADGMLEIRGYGAVKFIGAKRNFRRT